MTKMETGYRGRWKDPRMEIRAVFRKKEMASNNENGK
jgi:hypothetical protein